jgi:hypothetical protein
VFTVEDYLYATTLVQHVGSTHWFNTLAQERSLAFGPGEALRLGGAAETTDGLGETRD